MKIKFLVSLSLIATLILGSCANSNQVTNGGFLQKRKYTSGIYFKSKGTLKSEQSNSANEDLADKNLDEETVKSEWINESASNVDLSLNTQNLSVNDAVVNEELEVEPSALVFNTQKEEILATRNAEELVYHQNKTKNNSQKTLSGFKKKSPLAPASNVSLVLLVILALLIPPLAVFLYEDASKRFWIDLVLAILGYGIGFGLLGGLGWLCALVSVIYALLIVLEVI